MSKIKQIQSTILSHPTSVKFFEKTPQIQSQTFSLTKYLFGQSTEQSESPPYSASTLQMFELYEKFSIVYSSNKLQLYHVQIIEGKQTTAEYTQCQVITFDSNILSMCSNVKHGGSVILLMVQVREGIKLYRLEVKERVLSYRAGYSLENINSLCFFSSTGVCAITNTNRFWQLQCLAQRIIKKASLAFCPCPQSPSDRFIKGYLSGSFESLKQQYTIYYLFITQRRVKEVNVETIMIKQFTKRSGTLQSSTTYTIKDREIKKIIRLSSGKIFHYMNSFLLCFEDEIVIVKKLFDEYVIVDSIRKRTEDSYMMCNEEGLFCFCEKKIIEMCKMKIEEKRCVLENVNIVECGWGGWGAGWQLWRVGRVAENYLFWFRVNEEWNKEKHEEEKRSIGFESEDWSETKSDNKQAISTGNQNQSDSIVYDTSDPTTLKLCCLTPQNPLAKLLYLSKSGVHPKTFFQLSRHLNISKKDFFLSQWHNSDKHFHDINTFLFQTQDISTIKYELKMSYHKHAFQLNQHRSIYNKLLKMIEHQLTTDISRKLIRQYYKCHFLLRKLKLEYNKPTEYKEFMEISMRGVIEYIQKLYLEYQEISHLNTRQREKSGKTVKYELIIKNILSQYHVIFLENYQKDLIEIIKPFKLNLEEFFRGFPFFLPQYPYNFEFILRCSESPENSGNQYQHKLYNPIKESHWEEELSLQRLRRQLERYHPTSVVADNLNQVITHHSFKKSRLIKHGLILSNMKEYIEKASTLSGIKLFLKVCEFNNQKQKSEGSLDLIKIFQQKNNLKGEALLSCQFYSELHWVIWNHQVSQSTTMDTLYSLSTADIFALFFLSNKQKTTLVFDKLKPIYQTYSRKVQSPYSCPFSTALASFIHSDICSPVEVKQLLLQVMDKGYDFQNSNQQVIEIIIDGYCLRTEIRETRKMQELINQCLVSVKLSQELNEKIMRISEILRLEEQICVFESFKCDTISVYDAEKNGMKILSTVLQHFFEKKMEEFKIEFEDKQIDVNNPRNMLNILLLLSERLYKTLPEYDILVMYGMCLIQYQCFDILDHMIWEEEVLQLLFINRDSYCHQLIKNSLQQIYQDRTILTFQQVKSHIENILKLFPVSQSLQYRSQYLRRQNARYHIGQIITSANFQMSPHELSTIQNKSNFMDELIENGYEDLSLSTIRRMNVYLKRLHGRREDEEDDGDFLTWVALFAKMLIVNQSPRAMQSVNFLIEKECFYQLYNLFTEAMLQEVSRIYPEESLLAYRIVEHYVYNYNNYLEITGMFHDGFSIDCVSEGGRKGQIKYKRSFEDEVEVHQSYFYLHLSAQYQKLEDLRRIVQKVSKTPLDFYRYYYFLLSMLYAPERGGNLCEIFYDYQILWQLVEQTGSILLQKRELHKKVGAYFNNFLFQKNLFVGLCQEGCNLLNIESLAPDVFEKKIGYQNEFSILFKELKDHNHEKLLKVIKKCFIYLQRNEQANKIKNLRVEAYRRNLQKNIEQIEEKDRQEKQQFGLTFKPLSTHQIKLNKTMTYGEFKADYLNFSTTHPAFTDRQILDMIWEDKIHSPRTIEHKRDSTNLFLFSPTDLDFYNTIQTGFRKNQKDDEYYFELFETGDKQRILQIEQGELVPLLRKYYDYAKLPQFVKLLAILNIAQQRNLKMVQSALRLQFQLDFKLLFPFDFFFFSPDNNHKQTPQYFHLIFQYLKSSIKSIINENNWYISKIVYSFFKFDKMYQYKTIMLALEKYLEKVREGDGDMKDVVEGMVGKLGLGFVEGELERLLEMCGGKKDVQWTVMEVVDEMAERCGEIGREKGKEEEVEVADRIRQKIRALINN